MNTIVGRGVPGLGSRVGRRARARARAWAGLCLLLAGAGWTPARAAAAREPEVTVLGFQGTVEKLSPGATVWVRVGLGETLLTGDLLRTGERSRATLQRPDGTTHQVEELSTLQWNRAEDELPLIRLLKGVLKYFHRDRPGTRIEGGGVTAAVLGTEFVFRVDADDTVTLALYDGAVQLSNAFGGLTLRSGEVVVAPPGARPGPPARLMADDFGAIQWAVYYPAILDPADLGWASPPDPGLGPSLDAYREGRLPRALELYPAGRIPASAEERVYRSALLLSVGRVDEAESLWREIPDQGPAGRWVAAHRRLVDTVLRRPGTLLEGSGLPADGADYGATEWMALSYARQSAGDLPGAFEAARRAESRNPAFGFATVRRAELEFGLGRVRSATTSVGDALGRMPGYAPAHVLEGFLLAAANRMGPARAAFDRALALDAGMGDAWLGRGLTRIRSGDLEGGRRDLVAAAAVESQRAILRSYLGKAFADRRLGVTPALGQRARHELDLARSLDPRDPTPWLYGSLAAREENRINDAVRGLAVAGDLAGERAVYRSALLLDQDRAVAAASQAAAFRDAGFAEVGVQTAGRALARDPANPSAHQFLAESYVVADRSTLRLETPRVAEYLTANLLAPVGGGLLSAAMSGQEYSRLFERDGLGVFSQTTYLSRGAWNQTGGVEGTFGRSAFQANGTYASDPGRLPNAGFEQSAFDAQFKQQAGIRDTVYLQTWFSDLDAGDLRQVYDPASVDRDLRTSERLVPAILAGWHRAWSPDHDTLVLAGWIEGEQVLEDPTSTSVAAIPGAGGSLALASTVRRSWDYRSDSGLFTAEAQHLWRPGDHAVVLGVRGQAGSFDVESRLGAFGFAGAAVSQDLRTEFGRIQAYAYDTWRWTDRLALTAGLSYDEVRYPVNHRYAPLTDAVDRESRISPKAGVVWEPWDRVWIRGVYTRSLGGVGYDTSLRLEPTQVAGFNQAFRSLIPESVAGPSSVPGFETLGAAVETRVGTNTWLGLSVERLVSEVDRHVGIQVLGDGPRQIPEELRYEERALQFTANHLVGRHLALGLRYRLSEVDLETTYPGYAMPSGPLRTTEDRAWLQTLALSAVFNHESGFFAGVETLWVHQSNDGDSLESGEDLWQVNLWGGYRFAGRRAEVQVGVLNLTDADYRLNPLSPVSQPERERTFFARLAWRF